MSSTYYSWRRWLNLYKILPQKSTFPKEIQIYTQIYHKSRFKTQGAIIVILLWKINVIQIYRIIVLLDGTLKTGNTILKAIIFHNLCHLPCRIWKTFAILGIPKPDLKLDYLIIQAPTVSLQSMKKSWSKMEIRKCTVIFWFYGSFLIAHFYVGTGAGGVSTP